jgi:SAM-dependent methyltransferase
VTHRDAFFYVTGIGFLTLAKIKNVLRGYSTPKPFDLNQTDRAIDYDVRVVEEWLAHLKRYTREDAFLTGRNVLELGPGSDLGIGLVLLARGAASYNACDVNDLAAKVPGGFYNALFARLERSGSGVDVEALRRALHAPGGTAPKRLNYVVRKDFDLVRAFGEATIDLVFSQAAFEHFDDIETTVAKLSAVCRPGAVIVAEIDLQTHSRWIRDKDPNNIYRYRDGFYNAFWFRGIPNRVRPYRYKQAFERNGWSNVTIAPLTTRGDHASAASGMSRSFVDGVNQMDCLSVVLCATRSAAERGADSCTSS